MVNTMGWNERSDPDMRTANFCDVYREGVYIGGRFLVGYQHCPLHFIGVQDTFLCKSRNSC